MSRLVELAKRVIDEHSLEVENLINDVEGVLDEPTVKKVQTRALPAVKAMIAVEEAICNQMSKEEITEAKAYAEQKLVGLRIRAFTNLPKIGLNDFGDKDVEAIKAWASGQNEQTADTRFSYAVGFIVCHRKCCANDAGNGIAVGIGCYDCDNYVISEGCPPV
jgi:ferritin-like metal-binding protein YciE